MLSRLPFPILEITEAKHKDEEDPGSIIQSGKDFFLPQALLLQTQRSTYRHLHQSSVNEKRICSETEVWPTALHTWHYFLGESTIVCTTFGLLVHDYHALIRDTVLMHYSRLRVLNLC